jgi:RNA polymerase sigma-70 factor (ECF subfamily)
MQALAPNWRFTEVQGLANPSPASTTISNAERWGLDAPDITLVRATLDGDNSAFEELMRRHQPRVFGSVRRYVRSEADVQDVAQDIFIKAFEKLSSFRGEAPFEHWLMRMTVRCCFDYLRKHQRNRETKASELSQDDWDWLENVPSTGDVGDQDQVKAAREFLQKLMSHLPPPAQLIINLLEIEERSVKEIAEITGWSVPLVKVRAFRARAQLKKLVAHAQREKYL